MYGEDIRTENLKLSVFPTGQGAYQQTCPHCGTITCYDLEADKKILENLLNKEGFKQALEIARNEVEEKLGPDIEWPA